MGKVYQFKSAATREGTREASKIDAKAYGLEGENIGRCPECHKKELIVTSEPNDQGLASVACAECGFSTQVEAFKPSEMVVATGLRKAMGFSKREWAWILSVARQEAGL